MGFRIEGHRGGLRGHAVRHNPYGWHCSPRDDVDHVECGCLTKSRLDRQVSTICIHLSHEMFSY